MGNWNTWFWSTFDNRRYGFRRVAKINPYKVKCKCGYTLGFIYNKPQICPGCNNYVYPDKKQEFREKLMKEIRKNEEN